MPWKRGSTCPLPRIPRRRRQPPILGKRFQPNDRTNRCEIITVTGPSPKAIAQQIAATCKDLPTISIMEVCGTHTVALHRCGIRSLLPENVRLISGPGCPVCVSSQGYIDAACEIARRPNVIVCTYGDMIRVPGRFGSLQDQRAAGADVRVVYSAMDSLQIALANPQQEVVFIAIGFETTVAGHAAAVQEAKRRQLPNFSVLCAQKQVVPAMLALLADPDIAIDGFLCPGHVSVIIGSQAYAPVAKLYGKSCVVAGFEPIQMLLGIRHLVDQFATGKYVVENVYQAAVQPEGNRVALGVIDSVFESAAADWRAIGSIPDSGLNLRDEFRDFDAVQRFHIEYGPDYEPPGCRCGEVIQGKARPEDCPLFADSCTPLQPVGPCMVSSEGTCAAAYKYGRGVTLQS
ncbi:MAG: hydrogenase formation protein HypD [Planctomycetes bacterium]|nr:hydrogenase formation protein HypD [Planctomycetota bacterium]